VAAGVDLPTLSARMPQIVKPEMFFDASILDSSVMRLSHTSNWALGVALCREHERAFGFLRAPLKQFRDIRRHGHLPPRCFRFAERVEDRTLTEIQVLNPDSEDFLRSQAREQLTKELLCWFQNKLASSRRSDEHRCERNPKLLRHGAQQTELMERRSGTNPAQSCGLESEQKSGHGRDFFLDIPLYRTNRDLTRKALIFNGWRSHDYGLDLLLTGQALPSVEMI
jgi:hypothetical protein